MQCISMKVYNGNKVPCGKCGFCLTNKRSSWMFRVYHEMRKQLHPGYFITLTYDERHVRRTATGRLSLRFRDVQLYLKRIRKARYYAKYICVGEYGSKTKRPHYHMLLWTDAPARFLEKNWKSSVDGTPMGALHFGTLNMASAMYTLKYIIQPKQKAEDGLEKTRAQFSKGIGIDYLTWPIYEWHHSEPEEPRFYSFIDGNKVALPKYYRDKIFTKVDKWYNLQKVLEDSITKKAELVRDTMALGGPFAKFKYTRTYLKELEVERARRIIEKTKHNLTI